MRATASQIETIRTKPQRSRLYLSIFQPRIVFQAQINSASIGKGARTIPFDNVTLGTIADIGVNFTLLIGSTVGTQDIGKIRIRSVSATEFTVSENSNIAWSDNLYLSVQRYVELWPIFPRIIPNPNDAEDVTFLKDFDISYVSQNSILGTFPNAGPHRGLFKGENAYYTSSGTFNPIGSALTYDWAFEGGSPTGSTSAHPGNVLYNTPGDYVTRLIITAGNGASDTTYRYVSVYDRLGEGGDPPITKWELLNLGGSRDEGGYKASIRVHENVSLVENAVVVIFGEDWYGSTQTQIGGNHPNAEKIFLVGYILEDTIRYDWQHSFVEFQIGSITEVMKSSLGFSVSVESKASPSKWFELLDMDCRRAIYHYLRWHTTAMSIADFQFVGNDQKIQFFDADRGSMFDAIDSLMRNTLVGKVVSDRQGKVWIEQDARSYPNPTGSFASVMDITRRDWVGEPSIEERMSDQLSLIEYGGIAYSGVSTGTFTAHLAEAPGSAPGFRGRLEVLKGLAISGQSQLNTMVGNVYANENSPFPKIGMEMGVNLKNLDIAPQETTQITILSTDTVRNQPVSGLYIPAGMDWRYDHRNQILLPSIDFINLVNGLVADSIGMPLSVPDAGFETGFSVPGLQIPPLPILTVPPSLGSSINITTQINDFQQDYFMYSRGTNGMTTVNQSRGITIDNVSITNSASLIETTVGKGGVYVFQAFYSQQISGGSADERFQCNMLVASSPGGGWARSIDERTLSNLGSCTLHMKIGGVAILSAGAQFDLTVTPDNLSGGTLSAVQSIMFSAARVSA